MQDTEEKDERKYYDYSRLSCYNQCPRKHHYIYEEGIKSAGNEYTIVGGLFHQCVDRVSRGLDYADVIKEYEDKVATGVLPTESGLLEEVIKQYVAYYNIGDNGEKILGSEMRIEEEWEDGDIFHGTVDRLVWKDGLTILRDTKTTLNNLKYTVDDVKYNQQLLTYCSLIEENQDTMVDVYEIDEVRIARLQPVPLLKNGMPSKDKNKLSLVTYEAYLNKLQECGLENEPEYKGILEELEKRGHPLFRRTTCHLNDRKILQSNINDLADSYHACKSGNKQRVHGRLCNYCDYRELCNLDHYMPDDIGRRMVIMQITKDNSYE